MKRILVLLLALCLLLSSCLAEKEQGSAGFLYRVTLEGKSLYLLGSIHAGTERMYPFSSVISEAIASADLLVFECDTESEEAQALTVSHMIYSGGDSLRNHISPECHALLEEVCLLPGAYPLSLFDSLKPWAVTSILTASGMGMSADADPETVSAMSVEEAVRSMAPDKPEEWLETASEQLDMMESFSEDLQEALLADACGIRLSPEESNDAGYYPQWWHEGDEKAFIASFLQEFSAFPDPALASEYEQKLLTDRNGRILQKLLVYLTEDERSCFVTVGLAHLIFPDDNLILLLEDAGCSVERIRPQAR